MRLKELQATLQDKKNTAYRHAHELLRNAFELSKGLFEQAKDFVEYETQQLLTRLQEQLSAQQAVLEKLEKAIEQTKRMENDFHSKFEDLLTQLRPKIAAQVPFLSPAVQTIEDAWKLTEAKIKELLETLEQKMKTGVEAFFPTYQSATVKQIIDKLSQFNNEQLKLIHTFEQTHKNRVSVLRAIDAQLATK